SASWAARSGVVPSGSSRYFAASAYLPARESSKNRVSVERGVSSAASPLASLSACPFGAARPCPFCAWLAAGSSSSAQNSARAIRSRRRGRERRYDRTMTTPPQAPEREVLRWNGFAGTSGQPPAEGRMLSSSSVLPIVCFFLLHWWGS